MERFIWLDEIWILFHTFYDVSHFLNDEIINIENKLRNTISESHMLFSSFSALFEYVWHIDDLIEKLTLTEVINRVWSTWIHLSLSKEDYDYLQFISSGDNTIQEKGIFTRLIRKGLKLHDRDSKWTFKLFWESINCLILITRFP